jgi:hypothetical protein
VTEQSAQGLFILVVGHSAFSLVLTSDSLWRAIMELEGQELIFLELKYLRALRRFVVAHGRNGRPLLRELRG